jgi:hypothetical protein
VVRIENGKVRPSESAAGGLGTRNRTSSQL